LHWGINEWHPRDITLGRAVAVCITVSTGRLTIGDKKEIDKAIWRKPRGIRLTPTSRYIRDKLFPKTN
jgi:hypothetical protein